MAARTELNRQKVCSSLQLHIVDNGQIAARRGSVTATVYGYLG